jgi:hypothetical protein
VALHPPFSISPTTQWISIKSVSHLRIDTISCTATLGLIRPYFISCRFSTIRSLHKLQAGSYPSVKNRNVAKAYIHLSPLFLFETVLEIIFNIIEKGINRLN